MHPRQYQLRKAASGNPPTGPEPEECRSRHSPHPSPECPVSGAGPPAMTPQDFGMMKVAYSVNETLSVLSIGRTSLYKLVARGDLRPAKLGKKTLFYASDIANFLVKLRQAA